MIFSPIIFPITYFLKTFISSPFQAGKELYFDFKKDCSSENNNKKKNIIWICGLPKSGTTLIESVLDYIGYVPGDKSLLRSFDPSRINHPHDICEGHFKYFPKNKNTFIKTHTHHKSEFVALAKNYKVTTIISLRDIRPMMLSRYWHIMSDKKHWQHNDIKELSFEDGFRKSLISGYSYKNLSPIEYYEKWILDWLRNDKDANKFLWFEDYKLNPIEYIDEINKTVNNDIDPLLTETHLNKLRNNINIKHLTLGERLNLPGRLHTTIRDPYQDWREVISDSLNEWILSLISDDLILRD